VWGGGEFPKLWRTLELRNVEFSNVYNLADLIEAGVTL
jgi:hypothetical protein